MKHLLAHSTLFLAVMSAAPYAVAQSAGSGAATESRTTTVVNRARPELDPLGYRTGSFLLFPSLEVSESYNDNIFATGTDTKDDFITTIEPAVRASSDWNNHSLEFNGSATIDRYASNNEEDVEEFDIGTNGRLDIQRDTSVTAGLDFASLTEERGSPDDANGLEPTEYTQIDAAVGFSNRWNRVSLDADGTVRQYDFDDTPTSTGITNNDDRDRDEYQLKVRGGYEIVPQYEAYAEVILSSVEYDQSTDDSGLRRDNDGIELRAGARIDLTGLLFGDIFAGYITRDYDDPTLDSIGEMAAGMDLTWNATPLTTVIGTLSRTVAETTVSGASATLTSMAQVRVDHELLRNLILSGRVGFSMEDFEGVAREDEYLRGMLQARYLLNRYFNLSLRYEYTDRDSNVSGSDYDRNIVFLKLRAQL